MASLTVVYWRDIPAQVIAKQGRKSAKKMLSDRFQEAIDRAAMRSGAAGTDDYLEDWRRGDPTMVDGDLDQAARDLSQQIEQQWSDDALATLVAADGRKEA
ncbi:MAG: hypothetical protein HN725_11565 [Alphaproteobacteria bacterium]|jgi:hypothetical protein|nr:hypothetical protein [Alphaproteobacteria bacterium]MBT4084746.1 hypothetical protein [Alphaproteobacteria bacterium]MBT4544702.1 hypothetical protein [Alphaproteobacteria bacterium]MBT7745920.1 hypothetical protein [Alphaproteobacteria bacterium]